MLTEAQYQAAPQSALSLPGFFDGLQATDGQHVNDGSWMQAKDIAREKRRVAIELREHKRGRGHHALHLLRYRQVGLLSDNPMCLTVGWSPA
jgi:hypothetical protein